MTIILRGFVCAQIVLCLAGACRQETASEIVGKSYAAHGGVYSTDSLKISYRYSITDRINELQSRVPFAPFETYETNDQVWINKRTKKEFYRLRSTAAGFAYHNMSFIEDGKGFDVNVTFRNYAPVNSLPNPRHLFHHYLLQAASNDTSKLKYLGLADLSGTKAHHLIIDTIHLYLDTKSYLIQRLQRPIYDPVYGKGHQIIDMSDYVQAGRVMIPQKYTATRVTPVYDTVINRYTFSEISDTFEVPPAQLDFLKDFEQREANSRDGVVHNFGNGIYFIENCNGPGGPYHAIVAAFEDYVLITEAPLDQSVSRRVIQKAKEIVPGKPVRYVVQSHHHNDHIGGILGYVAEGAVIVTTNDAASLVTKMAEVFAAARNVSLTKPKFEIVNRSWRVKDSANECITFDIGPDPHSREILVTWFPKQKVLFQADLEVTDPGFIKKIKDLGLDVEILVSAHDKVIRGKELHAIFSR